MDPQILLRRPNDMLGFTDFFDGWRLLGSPVRIFVLRPKFRDDVLQGFEQLRRRGYQGDSTHRAGSGVEEMKIS